jgi:hypothetical protein
MKCVTVSGASVTPFIVVRAFSGDDWRIVVGERGRGRTQVRVPVPKDGTTVIGVTDRFDGRVGKITEIDRPYHLVLIEGMAGYRGGATFDGISSDWVIAIGHEAQGAAGQMGGADCYLLKMTPGSSIQVVRWGRLYGEPSEIEIRATPTGIEVVDAVAERSARAAASRF